MVRKKLAWIELGRGLAAIAVLLSHSSYAGVPHPISGYLFYGGELGVAFFFVLSGFIITYIHADDIGIPTAAVNFAWRRFIRIFPTYWLVLAIALLLTQFVGNEAYRADVTSGFLIKQIFILPGGRLFIPQAWSLRHELLFYAIFMVAILNVRVGLLLGLAWLAVIFYALIFEGIKDDVTRPAWDTLTSHLNLYFFFGIASALALRWKMLPHMLLATVLLLIPSFAIQYMPAVQLFLSVAIVCIAVMLSENGVKAPALSLWLGAISYPLYIFHLTAYQIAHGIY
jgi:exopolysaccharide production protein ExoZ